MPVTLGALFVFLVVIILLAVSGFLSMSGKAFASLHQRGIDRFLPGGSGKDDKKIKALLDDRDKLLVTLSFAKNIVNMAIVLFSFIFLIFTGVFDYLSGFGFIVILFVLGCLLSLFGEVVPRVALCNPLDFAGKYASAILFLEKVLYPFTFIFIKIARWTRRRAEKKKAESDSDRADVENKDDKPNEEKIMKGVIRFGEEDAKDVMTPRLDISGIDINTPYKKVISAIVDNGYSRIPIYEDSLDGIKGVLYIRDLFPYIDSDNEDDFNWQQVIRPPYFVPETKKINDLLKDFQKDKVHIAIVVDEFGGTSGLITMEDILEEIVGEIRDEYDDDEKEFVQTDDHTYIFEGKTLISDFCKILNLENDEFEDIAGDSDTLAGLLLEVKGDFPALHEHIEIGRYDFEILQTERRRISRIKLIIKQDDNEEKSEDKD